VLGDVVSNVFFHGSYFFRVKNWGEGARPLALRTPSRGGQFHWLIWPANFASSLAFAPKLFGRMSVSPVWSSSATAVRSWLTTRLSWGPLSVAYALRSWSISIALYSLFIFGSFFFVGRVPRGDYLYYKKPEPGEIFFHNS